MENTAVEVYEDMNQALTFGKYRGQPISVLAGDKSYCDWLVTQDWFRQKYQNVYNVIINNFSKPEDTPEHNSLQAMFLDEDFVKKFISAFGIVNLADMNYVSAYGVKSEFECGGWDVRCTLQNGHHDAVNGDYWSLNRQLYVEIKPVVGDDFPTVMRQMRANMSYTSYNPYERRNVTYTLSAKDCFLLYGDYTGAGISEMQMCKMFEANGFHVCRFDAVQEIDLDSIPNVDKIVILGW